MDISKLQLFVSLAQSLNYQRCAQTHFISASTLSRNIQDLENKLNVSLFERDNRHVELTKEGKQFLAFAKDIIHQWETAKAVMHATDGELSGTLSMYCSVTASYSFLFDILNDFRRAHPKIDIKLHTGDPALALTHVLAGDEDIAIAAKLPVMPKGIAFKQFALSPLVFIAPADTSLFNLPTKTPLSTVFETVPLIVSEKGLARERLNTWLQTENITPNIYAQVAGNEAIVSMVSLGLGVGLVPKIVIDNSPLAQKIRIFEHQLDLEDFEVGLCVLERRLKNPIVHAFWQQLLK